MKQKIRYILSVLMLVAAGIIAAPAAQIDEAKQSYRDGNYAEAVEKLRALLKRSPRDGTVNYYLGASLMAMGETEEAVARLQQAVSRGVADASRLLAMDAVERYDVEAADKYIDSWTKQLKKDRKPAPESLDELSARIMMMRNMLDRVEKIEIIDSLSVDSARFFEYYRLSSAAGRLIDPQLVSSLVADGSPQVSVAYMPENHTELLWSETTDRGMFRLFGADILDDGTIDNPGPLDLNLPADDNICYPFLMPDGETLYFAATGDNSLGGYDIFMTRRADGTFYQPQNVGMPYNSPANDYMLAIDEISGLGWWATDRNAAPGKVTIYIFAPSQMRKNVLPDDPNLTSLARLNDISLTRQKGVDYSAMLEDRMPDKADTSARSNGGSPRFAIDNGRGRVYTSLEQFSNPKAREAMLEALGYDAELRKLNSLLENLREKFRRGDRSVSDSVLDYESQADKLRRLAKQKRNEAISLESK